MKENLSEQICKLCGIRPRIKKYPFCSKQDEIIYPDFENNGTNFLKLFNLKYGQFTPDSPLTTHIFDSAYEISDATDYLFALIEFLKVEDGLQEHIKTVIRLTEWEW